MSQKKTNTQRELKMVENQLVEYWQVIQAIPGDTLAQKLAWVRARIEPPHSLPGQGNPDPFASAIEYTAVSGVYGVA
jgi:hypothetical protein